MQQSFEDVLSRIGEEPSRHAPGGTGLTGRIVGVEEKLGTDDKKGTLTHRVSAMELRMKPYEKWVERIIGAGVTASVAWGIVWFLLGDKVEALLK